QASPTIKAANEQADAKDLRARGERRQSYPSFDLAGQYGLLSRHNNYDEFFRKFQRHNVTVGVVIRFPFLNFSQRANAEAASAEAAKARKEAEAVKQQVATDTLRLQRAVRQWAAARDVAKLEYSLASSEVQAVAARLEAGNATVRDQENARIAENQKYAALLDATLQLEMVQMQLLRASGEIEKWALGN
ncbi:MAG: TolC family protein, partial [Terriglobales bacterium]